MKDFLNKKILVVAAHPDDEVIGCGGTIAWLASKGAEIYTLILGEGITSRDDKRDTETRKKELVDLKNQAKKASQLLGVKKLFTCDFPDNRFDEVPLLEIVKIIEKTKNEVKPDIIFTHYSNDLNIDHCITYKAVITAARPLPGEKVKDIYSFEILSSTEWNLPDTFQGNVFIDISETVDAKLKAMECYVSELKEFPHPRSLEAIRINSKAAGMKAGLKHAEQFVLVRTVI